MKTTRSLGPAALVLLFTLSAVAADWRVGIARSDVTPERMIWMAGYAGRDHVAEGVLHPLWAKAMALEDHRGSRAVIVTLDLIGLDRRTCDSVAERVKKVVGLPRERILFNSSHTNEVFAYVPSERVLAEGGYEGGEAMVYFGWYGPFKPGLENRLVDEIKRLAFECQTDVSAAPRPNLLLVTGDDLGLQLGCYGDRVATTPNLDKLAREGVRFTRAFVTHSSCSPSRSSMLTGLYPHQNGQIGLAHLGFKMKSDKIPTLPGLLKKAGYRTGIIGKLHVAPESAFPFDFREMNTAQSRDLPVVEKNVRQFLDGAGLEPFFLYVNFFDPHHPHERDIQGHPKTKVEAEGLKPWPFLRVTRPTILQEMADYYTCVNRVDEGFGILMRALAERRLTENTIVIVVGDNGPPFSGAKCSCYEAGLQIPYIVRWPGRHQPGMVRDELVSTVDLMPTLLEAAGAEIPAGLAGASLLPLLKGEAADWRTTLATEYTSHEPNMYFPQRCMRNDRYKLTTSLLHDSAVLGLGQIDGIPMRKAFLRLAIAPAVELYDLKNDPWERNNLAQDPEHQAALDELQQALQAWREATDDPLLDPAYLVRLTEEQFRNGRSYVPKKPAWRK